MPFLVEIWSLLSERLQSLKPQMAKQCQITLSCSIADEDLRNTMQIVVGCMIDLVGENFTLCRNVEVTYFL